MGLGRTEEHRHAEPGDRGHCPPERFHLAHRLRQTGADQLPQVFGVGLAAHTGGDKLDKNNAHKPALVPLPGTGDAWPNW
jgi:hypothetical protein